MKTHGVIRFAEFELDIDRYELRRAGEEIRLERLPMELLILLASRQGELIGRAEIEKALWGGSASGDAENGINTAIRKIRIALRDDPANPAHVKTVKGKGYRLDGIQTSSEREPPPRAEAPAIRMLVLPFANLTGDAAQDIFCDALAAETSATLGTVRPERLLVIARTTAARYRHSDKTIVEIARELALDYILEGALTRAGEHGRLLVHLVRCADQVQILSRVYERVNQGALDIQTEIAEALAAAVTPTLTQHQLTTLSRRLPVEPASHDAYLRGRYYWYRRVHFDSVFSGHHGLSGEDFFRSRTYFELALERDPTYALGYTGLSNFYGAMVVHGLYKPEQGWPVARQAAQQALELDPELPEAHHALGAVQFFYDWDWRNAEASFQAALHLNPSHPEAHRIYARMLIATGRDAEGHAQMDRAEQIDPLAFQGSRAFGLVLAGKYEEVVAQYFSGSRAECSPLIYQMLATAFEVKGLFKEAVEATLQALEMSGDPQRAQTLRACWADGGYGALLRCVLHDQLERHRSGYVSPLVIAESYARLDKPDEMFHWLEMAFAERASRLCELRNNPLFQRYRSTGRFRSLEKRIGY
jgi:DNA-binding winged helix-turn-helix (wHTH) protein